MIDRSAINRALAKACAYKQCGKDVEAEQWARQLVNLLECEHILVPEASRELSDLIDDPNWVGSRHHY